MFCSFNFFLDKNVISKAVCELKFKMKFKLLFNWKNLIYFLLKLGMGYGGIIMKLKLKYYHDLNFRTLRICSEILFFSKNAHNFNNKKVYSKECMQVFLFCFLFVFFAGSNIHEIEICWKVCMSIIMLYIGRNYWKIK